MSWKDMMRRVLPPIDGVMPDITSRYGEVEGRPKNSTKPHRGVDFNYWGVAKLNRSNPAMRAPVTGIVSPPDFQIPGLGPGEYEISAYRAGANGARAPLMNAGCAESVKVTVVEGSMKYITLRPCPAQ